MKKFLLHAGIAIFLSLVIGHWSLVRAAYTLPYPSYMPGNKLYNVSRILDILKGYWYFGNIAQIKYHIGLSDKYVVEAKTLFEYQQYLLAVDALNRSNEEFSVIPEYIRKAMLEGKDVRNLSETVRSAAVKHTEVLTPINATVPKSFLWVPEKSASIQLDIQSLILQSVAIRGRTVSELSE